MWDVFFSYSRGDAERVLPLLEALRGAGLKVFTDEAGVAVFSGISRTIRTELARSRALLAFYSREYPERQACQWELTAAYLAGLGEGDPGGRVMVVNPERGTGHIHPVELRDTRHWPWPPPGGSAATAALVADVEAHLARVPGPMGQPDWAPGDASGGASGDTPGEAPGDVSGDASGTRAHGAAARSGPPWLPGPRPTAAPRFVGRLPELWRVHSALHAHAAPLVTGSTVARAAQIRGQGGIGKSLLAQEYAQRFGAAFPGGVCWLDATDPHTYERDLGRLERRLETRDLYAHFEAAGAPFLFVVDGLPGGLTPAQAASFAAPHPLGRTLFTTRSRAYSALAAPVDLHPLDPEHARELADSAELAAETGGHAQALALLGDAVRAGQSPSALLSRLYAPGDSLLDVLAGDTEEQVTASLLRDALTAGPEAMDVLRCAVALSPLPLADEDVAAALTATDGVPPAVARRRTAVGLAELRVRSLLSAHAATEGGFAGDGDAWRTEGHSWNLQPVTAHAWRHHDPAPARTEALRHAMLRTLYGAWGTATQRTAPNSRRKARHMTGTGTDSPAGTPSESERMAAFDLQVELVTRIGVQELAPDAGSLREALSSLHALFGFTRDTLREYSISLAERPGEDTPPGPSQDPPPSASPAPTVQTLAHELLNGTLRPFTGTWHPRLAAYEDQRPEGVSPIEHETAWPQAPAMRADLAALRAPLHRIATDLATISGADFGLAATS